MLNVVKNGQQLSLDASGNLNVNLAAGSISGGNLAASATGAAVPAFAGYTGLSVGGNLVGLTGFSLVGATPAAVAIVDGTGTQITSFGGGTQYLQGTVQASPTGTIAMGKNPSNSLNALSLDAAGFLQVNVAAGSSGNAAAGLTGAAVPLSGDYTAYNSGGNLVGVSTANPLPVAQQGTVTVTLASTTITGTVGVTQSTSPWVDNITQFGSVNLSTGTGASGTGIPRVTVSNDSNILATQSGTWNVGLSAGSNTIGSVTQSGTWLVAGSDGSSSHTLLTDTSGALILSDSDGEADIQNMILFELRAMKAAIVTMVTETGRYKAHDFNAPLFRDLDISEMAIS